MAGRDGGEGGGKDLDVLAALEGRSSKLEGMRIYAFSLMGESGTFWMR